MKEVYRATLNSEGRVVIPAECRRQAGLRPGQEVLIKVTPDGLLVTNCEQTLN